MKLSRRNFIKAAAVSGAVLPFAHALATEKVTSNPSSIYYFTKDLDGYETEFMAETLAMTGVDGLDLTVRPGGKVDPSRVADELPKVIEIGNKYDLATDLMVTAITGTEDRQTGEVLKTASSLGVKHYRLGYYRYDMSAGILKTLEMIKPRLNALSEMNRQYGIQAGYQNHSGGMVGSPVWDVWEIIKDLSAETISSQFDIRHATVEGNTSWRFVLHLLANNIGSLAIKDFTWLVEKGRARVVNVPLGEGVVNFSQYADILRELNLIGTPITLHVEYPLLTPAQEHYSLLEKQKIMVRIIEKDVRFIRDLLS